jgi:hypothetical protein
MIEKERSVLERANQCLTGAADLSSVMADDIWKVEYEESERFKSSLVDADTELVLLARSGTLV